MNIKANRHGGIRNLAVGHQVGQVYMVAGALHMHAISVKPIELDVLDPTRNALICSFHLLL